MGYPFSSPMMRRFLAAFAVALFTFLLMGYLWWGRFQFHHRFFVILVYLACIGLVLASHLYFGDSWKRLGIRRDNLRPAGREWAVVTLLLVVPVVAAGLIWGHFQLQPWKKVVAYFLWALLQQHLIQNFLRSRSHDLLSGWFPPRWIPATSAVLAATLFALLHLPNSLFVLLSLLGALVWCSLFNRHPNLYLAAASHFVLAFLLILFFKQGPLQGLAVGKPGHRFEGYGRGVRVAAGYSATGEPRIATLPSADRGVRARVRIFDVRGKRLREWVAFPRLDFSGVIAVGELGFGPGDEIAVAAGPGPSNPARIRIFNLGGHLLRQFRVPDWDFGFGAWIAIGCGSLFVCPGPAPGAPQRVREYAPGGERLADWNFSKLDLINGLRAVALCAPREERVPGRQQGDLLLWGSEMSVNPSTLVLASRSGAILKSWKTLPTTFGLNVTPLRLEEGREAIAVAPGATAGYPAWVRVFTPEARLIHEFVGESGPESCGGTLAAVDVDGDGIDELVVGDGTGSDHPFRVRLFRLDGRLLYHWNAYRNSGAASHSHP